MSAIPTWISRLAALALVVALSGCASTKNDRQEPPACVIVVVPQAPQQDVLPMAVVNDAVWRIPATDPDPVPYQRMEHLH